MLIDGIFVMIKGKYIGPERPGPWANLFYIYDISVFKLGPLFILFGLMWLTWLYGFRIKHEWAYAGGIALAISTLWNLPVGTLFSINYWKTKASIIKFGFYCLVFMYLFYCSWVYLVAFFV